MVTSKCRCHQWENVLCKLNCKKKCISGHPTSGKWWNNFGVLGETLRLKLECSIYHPVVQWRRWTVRCWGCRLWIVWIFHLSFGGSVVVRVCGVRPLLLDMDVIMGVIEWVSGNTPTLWCSRIHMVPKKGMTSRRTVGLQPLKLPPSSRLKSYKILLDKRNMWRCLGWVPLICHGPKIEGIYDLPYTFRRVHVPSQPSKTVHTSMTISWSLSSCVICMDDCVLQDKDFADHIYHFTIKNIILLFKRRVVVPLKAWYRTLESLHWVHQRKTDMLAKASYSVWWPGLTKEMVAMHAACGKCFTEAPSQASQARSLLPGGCWIGFKPLFFF